MLNLAKSSEFKFGTTNMKHLCKGDLAETLQDNVLLCFPVEARSLTLLHGVTFVDLCPSPVLTAV